MKTASVSETKKNLSAILHQVREGETYLIVDRGKPIARHFGEDDPTLR